MPSIHFTESHPEVQEPNFGKMTGKTLAVGLLCNFYILISIGGFRFGFPNSQLLILKLLSHAVIILNGLKLVTSQGFTPAQGHTDTFH